MSRAKKRKLEPWAVPLASFAERQGLLAPEPEYKFHPERRWRFDLAWPEQMVAFEREGGVYTGGRHTRGRGYSADCEKYNWAAVLGWTVIRCTTDQLEEGWAYFFLAKAFDRALQRKAS